MASISRQTYKDWKCYIIDDISTDGSVELIKRLIKDDNRFELIENTEKCYPVGNHYNTIHKTEINNNDICISVDGDDWLPDDKVFERVISYYNDNILMSYGQFVYFSGHNKPKALGFAGIPNNGPENQRTSFPYITTHLRTFKAGLFRKIKKEDLLFDGKFYPVVGDVDFMCPMLEMAGNDRIKFTNDINYVYNIESNLNEFKVDQERCTKLVSIIQNSQRYKKI